MMFSGEEMYKRGWIRVVEDTTQNLPYIVGMTCVRHKVREPKTMLYYVIINPNYRREGLGTLLLKDLQVQTPHSCIELSCLKDNEEALRFYAKHGFTQMGESLKGKGWHLEKAWTK